MTLKFNEKSHRYFMDGKPVPSVTGALGVINKPAIPYWAARTVAEHVADNLADLEAWSHMGRNELVAALKQVPWTKRDKAAIRGTEVHDIAEKVIHGQEVVVPDHVAAFVEGYVKFLDDFDVKPLLTEKSIGNRKLWYAGRFDSVVEIPKWRSGIGMVDLKTSSGVYGETALQNAGYAGGEFYVEADDPDTEIPMPHIEWIAVAHVTEHGTFLYDLGDIEQAKAEFAAAHVLSRSTKRRKELIGDPITLELSA